MLNFTQKTLLRKQTAIYIMGENTCKYVTQGLDLESVGNSYSSVRKQQPP